MLSAIITFSFHSLSSSPTVIRAVGYFLRQDMTKLFAKTQ